jgi:NADH-quinone oxidoreductase subunit J
VLAQNIVFYVLALAMVIAALRVVTTKNVVHAALYLVMVLGGVGAMFVLLGSGFVFAVQLLVYIGAIVVLFLFGIMLTRAKIGRENDLDNDQRGIAALVALFILGILGALLYDAFGDTKLNDITPTPTADVGTSIFTTYLVPFEVISVLLLAALIGAVVLARRE